MMKKMKLVFSVILVMALAFSLFPVLAEDGQSGSVSQSNAMTACSIDPAYEMGMAYFNTGDMNGAIRQLSMVNIESPQYAQAQSAIFQAKANLREQELAIVDVYLSAGDNMTALNKLEAVIMDMPTDTVALAKYEETLARISIQKAEEKTNALSQAEQKLSQKDFSAAMMLLKAALEQMPEDKELNAAYVNTVSQYRDDFIRRIDALLLTDQTVDADALIQTALQVFPNDEELMSRKYNLTITEVIEQAARMEEAGNLGGAIAFLRDAGDDVRQNMAVIEQMERLNAAFRQQVIDEADEAYQSDGYLKAAQIIQKGQSILPDDSQLQARWVMYCDMAPVDMLKELEAFADEQAYITSHAKDNVGNGYEVYLDGGYMNKSHGTSISFLLDRKYSKLKGTAFLMENCRNTKHSNWVNVYGDGILLFESGKMTAQSMPEDFEIDVAGVDMLRIDFKKDEYFAIWSVMGIGNMQLFK